jgi:hypothetical protein
MPSPTKELPTHSDSGGRLAAEFQRKRRHLMPEDLVHFTERPPAQYLIAGWRRQWSDGGDISSGLSRHLIDKLGARKIGEMSRSIATMCYPFQVAGTHDAFRPRASFRDGLPDRAMAWDNNFYDAGNGLIVFRGEEPWHRLDLYGEAFFQAVSALGVRLSVTVEGYNGPAPPDLERRVGCVYSRAEMKPILDRYGLQYSSYGSTGRQGPTIGMALVSMAHYQYPEIDIFRLGAMAPMYPFSTSSGQQVGIATDHRAFYDIMKRLKSMFRLDLDLSDLQDLGESESRALQETLERLAASSAEAKQIIDQTRAEYSYIPFEEPVELDPELDRALQDILEHRSDEQQDT